MSLQHDLEEKLKDLIPTNHLERGLATLGARVQPLKELLDQRTIPEKGWSDDQIVSMLELLAAMDTDKDPKAARVGEREGRVASPLVDRLCAGFCHGIGRSGQIAAPQPKAPGGSIMYMLVNRFATTILRKRGLSNVKGAILLPLSTGMSIFLSLAACRKSHTGTEVVYPRVDHQSPLRGIAAAGYNVKQVATYLEGDAVRCDVAKIQEAISRDTAAIVSTTTFFPPREPDDVKGIAKLAADLGIPHVINNAYGVQSEEIMALIRSAIDAGRVDFIVQSTDKNFLTPVGGAIVAAPRKDLIEELSNTYAGRATAAPAVQFFAAMLSLGLGGYESLITQQKKLRQLLTDRLRELATTHKERILEVFNPIASAMTLASSRKKTPRLLGGALYTLRVTGPRVVDPREKSWGACIDNYPTPYLTMNAAIGATEKDIAGAINALDHLLKENP